MASVIHETGISAHGAVDVFDRAILVLERALAVNGALSVERVLTLPRNSVVKAPFTVTIKAGPADWATVAGVAHLRQRDISGNGQTRTSVVVDFGVMRTVSAVGLLDLSTFQIIQVKQWAGTAFAPSPLVSGVSSGDEFSSPAIDSTTAKIESTLGFEVPLPSEVRTDRLQIDLIGQGTDAAIGGSLLVQVPDLPADLDIRINGGQPVWKSPGAVAADAPGWTAAEAGLMQQQADISAALTALLADPSTDITDKLDLHIVLTARSPGALELSLPDPAAMTIRHVANAALASDTIAFDSEGAAEVSLSLPSYATSLERISLTATANLPPERVIPPLGPDAAMLADGATPLAEMLLDPAHSTCVAIPQALGFGELIALRFPFAVEDGGAEIYGALLRANADGDPGDPIPAAITKPLSLPANSSVSWVTLALARPYTLDSTPLYAQVAARRGRLRWALTATTTGAGKVFAGPPSGPWQPLPPLGEIAALRGRVRIVAHAKREAPVAPLVLAIQSSSTTGIEITPTPKGVAADISGSDAGLPVTPGAGGKVNLQVTSRVAGSVTLGSVIVTVAKAET